MTWRSFRFLPVSLPALLLIAPAAGATTSLPLLGATAGAQFGCGVSTAGDMNGDGYDDVVVGAVNSSKAFVYFGGPAADAVADLTLSGTPGDFFGASVAGGADVNGDGFDDVIVGAPRHATNAGRAYVYFGAASPDATADWILNGSAGDEFGWSVAFAGRFNADAFADVIVGAYVHAAGGGAGKATLFHGGLAPDVVADLTLIGAAANDNLGYSVASAGDVNDDGFDDVIVGALNNDAAGSNAGRAQIFLGGPGADAVADRTFPGHVADERFGCSVAGTGDVNGDGYDDVVVGALLNDAGGADAGRAYVYFGGPGADLVEDRILTGAVGGGRFGHAVSGAGDVNGDGHRDIVVGSPFAAGFNGRTDLFLGGPAADGVVDLHLDGVGGERLGTAVGGGGDVNGDGRADLALGGDRNATAGLDAGAAYLVHSMSPLPIASTPALALLGFLSVAMAGLALRRRTA